MQHLVEKNRPDETREARTIELPTGTLRIEVEHADMGLEELCDFAARRNPKRGFLFVSRVLGKHIPISPSIMRKCYKRLAKKIPADLPGPIVFVGMAETATAFGHGVYEEYAEVTNRKDLVFIHTTRYELDKEKALNFAEEHSHATDHILYLPEDPLAQEYFHRARSLVLLDDEASTGKTFVNLTKAFLEQVAQELKELVTVVITDWRGQALVNQRHQEMQRENDINTTAVALLSGRYSFEPHENLKHIQLPKAAGDGSNKDHLFRKNFGRFGLLNPLSLHNHLNDTAKLNLTPGERCLVLGTGEFSYLPFLLAERLEKLYPQATVAVQSTTRSPIMIHGAIQRTITFRDHCEEEIDNFLHNGSQEDFDRVVICTETPVSSLDPAFIEALGAEVIEL